MLRPWKAGHYLKTGSNWFVFVLFGWRFVLGIIIRWERREPFPSRRHHDSGNNKAASLLLLSFAKVNNTKVLLSRQTCHGILCLHLVTYVVTYSRGSGIIRTILLGSSSAEEPRQPQLFRSKSATDCTSIHRSTYITITTTEV